MTSSKWKHFPRNWPFVRGIHRSPVNSPHKGQWRVALMFSLICVWINGWVNNREACDLSRYRAHYDVTIKSTKWEYACQTRPSTCLTHPTCKDNEIICILLIWKKKRNWNVNAVIQTSFCMKDVTKPVASLAQMWRSHVSLEPLHDGLDSCNHFCQFSLKKHQSFTFCNIIRY